VEDLGEESADGDRRGKEAIAEADILFGDDAVNVAVGELVTESVGEGQRGRGLGVTGRAGRRTIHCGILAVWESWGSDSNDPPARCRFTLSEVTYRLEP